MENMKHTKITQNQHKLKNHQQRNQEPLIIHQPKDNQNAESPMKSIFLYFLHSLAAKYCHLTRISLAWFDPVANGASVWSAFCFSHEIEHIAPAAMHAPLSPPSHHTLGGILQEFQLSLSVMCHDFNI